MMKDVDYFVIVVYPVSPYGVRPFFLFFWPLMLCVSEKLKINEFWLKWKVKIGDKHWPKTRTAHSEELLVNG